jgi:pimeloyl-ACP methyl ester carboxylesterase
MPETRPRIVFVHGSVTGGGATWSRQRPLAERFALEILERPGFPPDPPVERVDFEADAVFVTASLGPSRAHLVGHSYGGVVSLLAAAAAPDRVRSLTVIEPPATRIAAGNPVVDAFARDGAAFYADGPRHDPEAFLRAFLAMIGSEYVPPHPLPPAIEQGARLLVAERGPWEAEIPLEALAAARFPVLAVSGGRIPAFEAVCDVLAQRLAAERVVLPGHGHAAQLHPDFNRVLADFVLRAEAEG